MGITGLLPLLKDITCDVLLRSFSGKVAAIDVYCCMASQNCYFLRRRDNFRDRNNAVRINTSFLHVLKLLDCECKLVFGTLLTSDIFSGILTRA